MNEPQDSGPSKTDTQLERIKIGLDLVKHVSTLAAGSIVLLATFLDKFPRPLLKGDWLTVAVWLLCGCLVCCLVYILNVGIGRDWGVRTEFDEAIGIISGAFAAATCVAGIISLGIFVMANINRPLPMTPK